MHIHNDFEPFLSALRTILVRGGYAVMITAGLMLIIDVTGSVLLHFLRTRQKFPVHQIYMTTTQEVALASNTRCCDPSDDNDSDLDVAGSELRTFPRSATDSPEKRQSLLTNFKYSETKV